MKQVERTFFPSGKVELEYCTLDGVKHGTYTRYYENGQIAIESNYVRGLRHGDWKAWYENGQLEEIGRYVSGKYHVSDFWAEDGKQLLRDGTGMAIRKYGATLGDVYEQYFENGEFKGEKKIAGVAYGIFTPGKTESDT